MLSNFETVNPFNGNLNFALPLLRVQGRGKAGYQITRPINHHWTVETLYDSLTLSTSYTATPSWWEDEDFDPYGPGKVIGRNVVDFYDTSAPCAGLAQDAVTKLTFIEADGTEHELHDQNTNAKPMPLPYTVTYNYTLPNPYSCAQATINYDRGTVFQAMDGSGLTFIADMAIQDGFYTTVYSGAGNSGSIDGRLLFRDGTEYRFKNGVIEYIRDANGNAIVFSKDPNYYRIASITDSLDRTVLLAYDVPAGNQNPNGSQTCPVEGTRGCDFITYGDPSNRREITIVKTTHDLAFRPPAYSLEDTGQLFGGITIYPVETFHVDVIRSVVLPDQRQYTLSYNPYAELARVQLPTGGAFEYDWDGGVGNENLVLRRVTTRRVYSDAGSSGQGGVLVRTETYGQPQDGASSFYPAGSTQVTVTSTDSSGQPLKQEYHYYYGSPKIVRPGPLGITPWQEGREYQHDISNGSNQQLLRSASTLFAVRPPFQTWTYGADSAPSDSPVPCQETVTLDGLVTSTKVMLYDQDRSASSILTHYGNLTDAYEYDYGSSPAIGTSCYTASNIPAGYYRHAHSTYWTSNYDTTQNVHLLSLLGETVVSAPPVPGQAAVPVSDTKYYYDETGLTSRDNASTGGLPGDYIAPDTSMRGNLTRVSRLLITTGSWIDASQTFDVLGNVVSVTDPRKATSQLAYDDQFSNSATQLTNGAKTYAFPTTFTNAKSQTANTQYDYYQGKPTSFTDPNTHETTYQYQDVLDRLTDVFYPDGGTAHFDYINAPSTTTVRSTRSVTGASGPCLSGVKTISSTVFDGLGRKTKVQTAEGGGTITTDIAYDALGRVWQVSNPYRSTSDLTYGLTSTYFDALDRPWKVIHPDGSTEMTAYSGNVETLLDQRPVWRELTTDAFGRVQSVVEDPSNVSVAFADSTTSTSSSTGLNFVTQYGYDALDDLTSVIHNGDSAPTRGFVYDSLKRLTSATNPENGTIGYTYDENGNVVTVTDARGVVKCFGILSGSACSAGIGYSYDALNRPLNKTYYIPLDPNNGNIPVAAATPNVAYAYDSASGGIGHLSSVTATDSSSVVVSATSYSAYDSMGRVTASTQTNGGSGYTFAYAYNVGGLLEQQTFQNSGRALTYCYDDVGRLASVTGKIGASGASTPYASLPETPSGGYQYSYAPHGAAAQMTLGNGLVEQTQFNSRLQPCAIRAGATPLSASSSCPSDLSGMAGGLLYLVLGYGATGNNGNLQSQQIGVRDPNAQSLSWAQAYGYDTLNRLSSATETLQSALPGLPSGVNADNWTLIEGIDDRGNHWETASAGSPTPTAASQFDRSTNRVRFLNDVNGTALPADAYDPAGNLRDHPYIGQMQYDGENHLAEYVNGGITAQYTYDGDGRRVGRVVTGTSPSSTTYVYDAAGQLAAEYSTAAAVDAGTTYLTADHLGSTRLVTDGSQKPVHRFDYMPFGQDLSAYGNRNLVASYRALGVPAQEFTGKERDVETGLDYFGARYFSAAQGRFTSPDPIHIMPQKLLDPQQWNMFAYVRNNPLRLVDPTGMYVCNASKNECKAFEKARQKDLKSKNSAVHNAAVGYGDAGKDNGVTVRFGDPGDGNNGNTTTQLKYYQKTNTWQAAADVVIKTGLSGNALQATVGHEGVHIENAQDFVSTITSDFHYDLSKNLTHWQTEMNAYAVTAAIDPGHSYGTCGSGPCAPAQGMSAQAVAITTMIRLANPANGYNRFVDVGNGTMVGVLGMRQFADITTPNPPKQ